MEGSFQLSRGPGIPLCFRNKLQLLIRSAQDDLMIEIFDNAKYSVGMKVESSILTKFQSERLAFEWGRIITGFMLGWRKNMT